MVPHLAKCVFVAPDVKACALEEINRKKQCRHGVPPLLGRSASLPLPLPAIVTGLGHAVYQTASLTASAMPSPVPVNKNLITSLTNWQLIILTTTITIMISLILINYLNVLLQVQLLQMVIWT
jgi:hypothetical protein